MRSLACCVQGLRVIPKSRVPRSIPTVSLVSFNPEQPRSLSVLHDLDICEEPVALSKARPPGIVLRVMLCPSRVPQREARRPACPLTGDGLT